ncbi:MATH domain and coiled-coil domain-containing protein At3g58270 isoform X1 [Eucalyptus grandis]|uniref:MATH domain and coiled-coil domain-containing protein At3g58270 isoform X1 n=1 Tax=Eucalyptus grandis TaxID=71139 RepID=UPI00192EB1CF|nr:MATH domain and coiled-coil domain-containing protein At3g58270 isoform X1 [Eucalyptus grandis]XP_039160377.1 MATH domain and coiled-coil domain-containing protein At3g58270 isoform X1 [Eucalyptus grandis]
MDAQDDVNQGEFTWAISNFSQQKETKLYSEAFTVFGCKWMIVVYPKGNKTDHLSLYLDVPDSAMLPDGWTRNAKFSLCVIDQISSVHSIRHETQHFFTVREKDWGFTRFIALSKLHNSTGGYLANDFLVIKAKVSVLIVTPVNIQPARPTDKFDSYFTGLEELINAAETNGVSVGSSLYLQDCALTDGSPSLEETEKAKQSLKECLSDLFRLGMKERLSETLSTLSSARTGLSSEEKIAIETFQANFNDFTSNFLTFEQDNAEVELHKVRRDQNFSAMKKSHETHILYKQLMDHLAKEEEELKRKMEEVKSGRNKLLSDWEILLVESEDVKSLYKDEQKKVAEAEKKKRIAEERMSRSTIDWSKLKAQFC